jgi:hypothetical protein
MPGPSPSCPYLPHVLEGVLEGVFPEVGPLWLLPEGSS